MQELNSLPASLRQRLQLAEDEYEASRQPVANPTGLAMQQAVDRLAQSNPEVFAALVATSFGFRQLTQTVTERNVTTSQTEKKVLGIRVGVDSTTTTTEKTITRSLRFD